MGSLRLTRFPIAQPGAILVSVSENPSPSSPADHAGVAFPPPLLLALAIGAGFVLRGLLRLSFLPDSLTTLLGPIVASAALALFSWAVATMARNGASISPGEPTDVIVERGPFRFSRNPIYLGMILLQVGIGIWADSLWFLVMAVLTAVLLTWGVIIREERYLERKFGETYVGYKAHVRRWI